MVLWCIGWCGVEVDVSILLVGLVVVSFDGGLSVHGSVEDHPRSKNVRQRWSSTLSHDHVQCVFHVGPVVGSFLSVTVRYYCES